MLLRHALMGSVAALALAAAPIATSAMELTMFHTWSNDSEMAALNAIVEPYTAKTGNTVKAASVPHETAGESALTSLIIAGTPPNMFIAADAGTFRDLASRGMGQEVGTLFDSIGATAAFPETVLKAITIDGEVRKIPIAVHLDGMVYYSKEVAEPRPASIRPSGPRSRTCGPTRRRSRTPASPSSPSAATPSRRATPSTPCSRPMPARTSTTASTVPTPPANPT